MKQILRINMFKINDEFSTYAEFETRLKDWAKVDEEETRSQSSKLNKTHINSVYCTMNETILAIRNPFAKFDAKLASRIENHVIQGLRLISDTIQLPESFYHYVSKLVWLIFAILNKLITEPYPSILSL
jgi:hypothetical protein